jgi:hypothetical protein
VKTIPNLFAAEGNDRENSSHVLEGHQADSENFDNETGGLAETNRDETATPADDGASQTEPKENFFKAKRLGFFQFFDKQTEPALE